LLLHRRSVGFSKCPRLWLGRLRYADEIVIPSYGFCCAHVNADRCAQDRCSLSPEIVLIVRGMTAAVTLCYE
jgi:hypothetical protein